MTAQFAPPDTDHPILRRLSDPGLLPSLAAAGQGFAVTDPATGGPLARVAALGAAETTRAIDAAARAFPPWRDLPPAERGRILRRWHDLMLAAREDLAVLMVLEQGKPIAEARGEIAYAASFLDWYAAEAQRMNAEGITSHLPGAETFLRREAIGVAGLVTPWNFPSAMLARKAAAALAAGCTVVAHPSSETPLSALALAELGARAGLPAGVLNLVTGPAEEIVGRICGDARVRVLSFTGSTEIGRRIAARCAPTVKRLVLELGGHAPLIVFDDADPEKAADIAMAAKFATSGQDCLAANRIYVQRGIMAPFLAAFRARIAALKTGPGLDPDSGIGPLMHARAMAKAEAQIGDATARGARLLEGGARHPAGPLFLAPTLLADVPDDALIMQEESFAPVAAVAPFDTEPEVVARANATEYGLVAYVVTENGARQMRLARALDYGMVAVNRVKITGAPVPFGGWKQSGLGREGARQGLEAFTELKYLCIDTGA